jgi:hypothetical protein
MKNFQFSILKLFTKSISSRTIKTFIFKKKGSLRGLVHVHSTLCDGPLKAGKMMERWVEKKKEKSLYTK